MRFVKELLLWVVLMAKHTSPRQTRISNWQKGTEL